jgi:hypothetical protein
MAVRPITAIGDAADMERFMKGSLFDVKLNISPVRQLKRLEFIVFN